MRAGATPVPIPNTMVKTRAADGTVLETVWESRRMPDLWGYSSAGRAPALQAGGHEFESRYLHLTIRGAADSRLDQKRKRKLVFFFDYETGGEDIYQMSVMSAA